MKTSSLIWGYETGVLMRFGVRVVYPTREACGGGVEGLRVWSGPAQSLSCERTAGVLVGRVLTVGFTVAEEVAVNALAIAASQLALLGS